MSITTLTEDQIKGAMRNLVADKVFKKHADFKPEAIHIDEFTITGIIYRNNSQVSKSFSITINLT